MVSAAPSTALPSDRLLIHAFISPASTAASSARRVDCTTRSGAAPRPSPSRRRLDDRDHVAQPAAAQGPRQIDLGLGQLPGLPLMRTSSSITFLPGILEALALH
jgi:hypothetical protein